MDHSQTPQAGGDGFPPPLTPERAQRALDRVAAIHEEMRRQGIDLSRLPDPVEALIKAREAGSWE